MSNDFFQFKQFIVRQDSCAMKVGTDGTLLGAWARGGERILDIGTGTGLIALMMAQRFEKAIVDAIDIDAEACDQARRNAAESPFRERINVCNKSLQEFAGQETVKRYDSIVSNPPYFVHSLKASDERRSMARHAETLSYYDLMKCSSNMLSEDGEMSVVIPFDCRKNLEEAAILSGLFSSRICAVKTKPVKAPKRYLLAFTKHPTTVVQEELVIGSDEYVEMMKDFYLKL
ncbi:MAG: methyltransferase [Bacteroidales bacterium]|nr:methyltransferase [Bacteroidales bacterium]